MGKIGPEPPRLPPTSSSKPDTQQPSTSKQDEYNIDFTQDKRAVKPRSQTESQPIELQNRFKGLDTDIPEKDTDTEPRIKYTIRADFTNIKAETLKHITGPHKTIKIRYTNNAMIINTESKETHDYVTNKLHTLNIKFATINTSNNQIEKITLKGLPPHFTEEEIKTELTEQHYPILHVRQICRSSIDDGRKQKTPLPIWVLTLQKTSDITDRLDNLTSLFNIKIRTETYKAIQGIRQCYNCQDFGHTAQLCNRPPKCVRCGENHSLKECTNINLLKCANCNEKHPASFRQCKYYISRNKSTQNSTQTSTQNRPQTPTQTPTQNRPRTFPPRDPTQQVWGKATTQTRKDTPQDFPPLPQRTFPAPNETTRQTETSHQNTNSLQDLLTLISQSNITQHLSTILNILKLISQNPQILNTVITLISTLSQNNGH